MQHPSRRRIAWPFDGDAIGHERAWNPVLLKDMKNTFERPLSMGFRRGQGARARSCVRP
jgi:hypothetical protein